MAMIIDEDIEQVNIMVSDEQIKMIEGSVKFAKPKRNTYNLKAELEELVGISDFNNKLNQVNFIIGIIVLLILLTYFLM